MTLPGDEDQPSDQGAMFLAALLDDALVEDLADLGPARVLRYGIDTLYFSFTQAVSDATYQRLLEERDQAQATQHQRNAAYCSEWLDAQVYPHGANGFGILIDRGGAWAIKVQRGNRNRPGVFVEVRSLLLHTHPEGPLGACADVIAYLRETLYADLPPSQLQEIRLDREKLSRIDYHLDYQGGWHPTLEDPDELQRFIKPARAKWSPYYEGTTCTGYSFGRRRIMGRIYNKSIEARHRHNDAFFTLLAETAGDAFHPEEDVWRVEFELKREGVQGFCLAAPQEASDDDEVILAELEAEDLPTLGTIRKALHWGPTLWQYLTTRWLRVTVPDGDTNKARWATHPTWAAIQAGYMTACSDPLPEEQGQLVREGRHSGYRRLITRLATALATTAYTLLEGDPAEALPAFCQQVERLASLAAAHQQAQRATRRKKLDDERQERYLEQLGQLARMAGGTFAIAGVLSPGLPKVGDMPELLQYLGGELDDLARYQGGVPQMLYDKYCRTYKVVPPRGLFRLHAHHQARRAA